MILALAWRNLWRHGRRTLITAIAMGVSIGFVMAIMAYMDGTYRKMTAVMVDQELGHVEVHNPDYAKHRALYDTIPDATARVAALRALPDARAVADRAFGYALLAGKDKTAGAMLIGVDPTAERAFAPIDREVVAGRYLGDAPAHEVVLGAGLAHTLQVGVGDEVVAVTQASDGSLGNDLYTVVGVLSSGSVARDRSGAWLNLADLQDLLVLPDQVHELVLLTPSREARAGDSGVLAAAEHVRTAVAGTDGAPLEVQTWWDASPQTAQLLSTSDASAWITLGIVYGVAGLGILNTMLMSVLERTRELGVMKALGTRPGKIIALVLWESVLLSSLSCAAGLTLGGILDWLLVDYGLALTTSSGKPLSMSGVVFDPVIHGVVKPERIVVTVVALLVVAILAALWPAVRAARLRPIEAMQDR